jgi:hypothetical protein
VKISLKYLTTFKPFTYKPIKLFTIVALVSILAIGHIFAQEVSKEELKSISTPDKVETTIGELNFFDGVPTDETVQKVYDNLDGMRGVEVFLNTIGGPSVYKLRTGNAKIGVDKVNKVAISSQLLNSKSLYLTASTSYFLRATRATSPVATSWCDPRLSGRSRSLTFSPARCSRPTSSSRASGA